MGSNEQDQITSLLGEGGGSGLSDLNSMLASFAPMLLALTIFSILFVVLYIVSAVQKWRVNKAILEIRNTLNDIARQQSLLIPKPTDITNSNTSTPEPVANQIAKTNQADTTLKE